MPKYQSEGSLKRNMKHRTLTALVILLILSFATQAALAQDKQAKERRAAAKTARLATNALNQLMGIPASAIPDSLMRKAEAIAVFPNVVKAAFVLGGSGGKGLISRRTADGWSVPAMFTIGSGSIGFQIGASSTDIVLVFTSEEGLDSLLGNRFEIGGEASAAAGPVGRTARATTDAQMRAKILSYSRSRGVFAGISITGAVVAPDNDANMALYGLKAKEVLGGANSPAPDSLPSELKNFVEVVARYSR